MDFFNHLEKYLSKEDISKLEQSLSKKAIKGVLLNTNKMDDDTFLSLYPLCKKHPLVEHAYIYDDDIYPLSKSIYYELGAFYLQEPSAMIPPSLLDLKEDDIVLDICSAPGGKSIHSSFLKNNKGIIISNDISYQRCLKTIENVEKLGIGNIIVTCNDFSKIYINYLNYFDKIIVDAPCSGSGMFRKDDKFKKDWSFNKVIKYQAVQKELILYAYNMLKPGGKMVYSTCSYSIEEDEEVIEYLLNKSDAQIEKIKENDLFYINNLKPYGVHLFPFKFDGEGHYICLISKPIDNIKRVKKIENDKNNLFSLLLQKTSYQGAYKENDYLFIYPHNFNEKGLNILRKGVMVGKIIKNNIPKLELHYARFIDNYINEYNLNLSECEQYINNHSLNVKLDKGLYLLKYNNLNLSFATCNNGQIKNWYPKSKYIKKYN